MPATDRWANARDVLAATVVGSYVSLRDESLRLGEGRVRTIVAIADAERVARQVPGIVVFERGGALHVDGGVAAPDHRGLAGTFAAFLGHMDVTTMAVLPSELYLPARSPSISTAIATYLRSAVIGVELPQLLVELLSAGLALDAEHRAVIVRSTQESVAAYLAALGTADAVRVATCTERSSGRCVGSCGDGHRRRVWRRPTVPQSPTGSRNGTRISETGSPCSVITWRFLCGSIESRRRAFAPPVVRSTRSKWCAFRAGHVASSRTSWSDGSSTATRIRVCPRSMSWWSRPGREAGGTWSRPRY